MPPMPRLAPALVACAVCLSPLAAQEPKPDPVAKALAVQNAIAAARQHLAANDPARAVEVLEARVPDADGSSTFLSLLRDAYTAELKRLEASPTPDAATIARIRQRLNLLGGAPAPAAAVPSPAPPAPDPPANTNPWTAAPARPEPAKPAMSEPTPAAPAGPSADELLGDARALFKQRRYADAAPKFAAAVAKGAAVNQNEVAVWAYCRIKVASEKAATPNCDPATAAALEREVREAIALAPSNPELQKVGQALLVVLGPKAGGAHPPAVASQDAGWEVIDTPSFRVRFRGTREVAEAVAQAAEAQRKAIFERWSGPPAGAWSPRCEISLHPTADEYARATGKPAQGTGHAVVRLSNAAASERKVELRADDPGAVANALPRELTHVVLADLFPHSPPPRWAEEGMAVLAGSPEEVDRYSRTLPRCARTGELLPVATLLEMKDFPAAERITGFYCASVTLVEYLVKLGGERNFTIFLRDCQRYGTAQALKRCYKIDGPAALESAWKRSALDVARAPGP
jgi:hypothetical protein